MPRARIIIADSKDARRKVLKETLIKSGFQVQAEARNFPETLRKCRTLFPDLVIIDSNLEGGSILELAGIIEDDNITSVLILTGFTDNYSFRDYAHINKPFTEETLISVIEVSLHFKNQVDSMKQTVNKLREDINTRKIVERAKGILMKELRLDEAEAYRRIQKESMNRGIPKKEIARAVIVAYEGENERRSGN